MRRLRPGRRLAALRAASAVVCALAFACAPLSAQAPLDIRIALVIGNAAYPGNAALANPANDARAMGETLRSLGFGVTVLLDAQRQQMTDAIAAVGRALKDKQGVGMLYYAGHGLQLDWHNYMVPVDARLTSSAEVPRQAVDINTVMDTFKAAGARMNIMVLDACRDNPFANTASARGLAQQDAPPGTFLAYATAPGNVAEDGDTSSGNGLYTQYLLAELRRPAVRIEDVFKRVRLHVRKQSGGRQIPWESTSLEDDFSFNDGVKFTLKPEELARIAEAARLKEAERVRREAEAREAEAARLRAEAQSLERRRQEAEALAAQQKRLAEEASARDRERQLAQAREAEQKRLALAAETARLAEQARAAEETRQREARAAAERAQELIRLAEAARLQEIAARESAAKVEADRKAAAASKEAAEKQRQQAIAEEKLEWDKVRDSTQAADLYAFLQKYPNGYNSETAQFQLDRIERPLISAQPGKDGVVAAPAGEARYRVGDVLEYANFNPSTGGRLAKSTIERVTSIEGDQVIFNNGNLVRNLMGNQIGGVGWVEDSNGRRKQGKFVFDVPSVTLPAELAVGKAWRTAWKADFEDGSPHSSANGSFRIVALEAVTVPAGTFKAYKITGTINQEFPFARIYRVIQRTYWVDSASLMVVKNSVRTTSGLQQGGSPFFETALVSFKRGRAQP